MRLPSAASAYEQRGEDDFRRTLEQELERLSAALSASSSATQIRRIQTAASITIASPALARDGYELTLDVANTSGGAIVVTLNAAYLGTFPAPGAGKRRTQRYSFDASTAKWVPVGAQSPDL
jgi:hypothetical protein